MTSKTILITGASGYLGSRITKRLLQKGHTVIAATPNEQDVPTPQNNLEILALNKTNPRTVFETTTIDGVIHFATCYGRNGQNAAEVAQVNLLLPLQLLSLAVEYHCQFFINTDTILQPDLNPYSLTKHQFSQWLAFYSNQIQAINMRLDHFYGPFDHPVKFIAWLIEKFKNNVDHIDLTEGAQKRDFIYIDDVVNAYLTVFDQLGSLPVGKMHTFEVGSGTKTSIKNMVLLLQKLLNKPQVKLNFGALPYRPNERLDYTVDTSALQALGWHSQFTLTAGLQQIIKEENL